MEVLALVAATGIQLAGNIQLLGTHQHQIHHLLQQVAFGIITQRLTGLFGKFGIIGNHALQTLDAVGWTIRKPEIRHHHGATQHQTGFTPVICGGFAANGTQRRNHIGEHACARTTKQRAKQIDKCGLAAQTVVQVRHKLVNLFAAFSVDGFLAQKTFANIVEHRCTYIGMPVKPVFQIHLHLVAGIQSIHQKGFHTVVFGIQKIFQVQAAQILCLSSGAADIFIDNRIGKIPLFQLNFRHMKGLSFCQLCAQ